MENIKVLVNGEFRERVFAQKYYDKMAKFGEVAVYDKKDFSDLTTSITSKIYGIGT